MNGYKVQINLIFKLVKFFFEVKFNIISLLTLLLALLKRDYIDNLNEYNRSLKDLQRLFKISAEDSILLDTTSINDVSVEIVSQIMSTIRKRYIKIFKKSMI